jgi:hypothetical protein
MAELGVAVGVLRPLVLLRRRLQAVAHPPQQVRHRHMGHHETLVAKLAVQRPRRLRRPAQRRMLSRPTRATRLDASWPRRSPTTSISSWWGPRQGLPAAARRSLGLPGRPAPHPATGPCRARGALAGATAAPATGPQTRSRARTPRRVATEVRPADTCSRPHLRLLERAAGVGGAGLWVGRAPKACTITELVRAAAL